MTPQVAVGMLRNDTDKVFSSPELVAEMCRVLLRIRNKEGKIVPLDPNNTQVMIIEVFCEQWREGKGIRIVCLKGRQQGSSTIAAALVFLMLIAIRNLNALLASEKKGGSAINLWNVYTTFMLRCPLYSQSVPLEKRFQRKGYEKNTRFELKNGSELRVEGQGKILSYSNDIVHISEAGFFHDLQGWLSHALPSLEDRFGTMIIVESTALNYGDGFHDIWLRAQEGESGYEPIFAAWFVHERNVASPAPDLENTLGMLEKYGDELALMRDHDLSLEQMQFRRNRINQNASVPEFQREYPSTPEEAFLAAERPVLHQPSLQWFLDGCEHAEFRGVMKPEGVATRYDGTEKATFEETSMGFIDIYEKPIAFEEYIAGSDHAKGSPAGDWNAGLIAKRSPFEIVAKLRGSDATKLEAGEFGKQWYYLLRWYNFANWLAENNYAGKFVIDVLYEWDYPNIIMHRDVFPDRENKEKGWSNTSATRYQAIELLVDSMRLEFDVDGSAHFQSELTPMISDSETILECMHLVYNQGKPEAKRKGEHRRKGESQIGYYDDLVFALIGLLFAQRSLPTPLVKEASMLRELGGNHSMTVDLPIALKQQYAKDLESDISPNAWLKHL